MLKSLFLYRFPYRIDFFLCKPQKPNLVNWGKIKYATESTLSVSLSSKDKLKFHTVLRPIWRFQKRIHETSSGLPTDDSVPTAFSAWAMPQDSDGFKCADKRIWLTLLWPTVSPLVSWSKCQGKKKGRSGIWDLINTVPWRKGWWVANTRDDNPSSLDGASHSYFSIYVHTFIDLYLEMSHKLSKSPFYPLASWLSILCSLSINFIIFKIRVLFW